MVVFLLAAPRRCSFHFHPCAVTAKQGWAWAWPLPARALKLMRAPSLSGTWREPGVSSRLAFRVATYIDLRARHKTARIDRRRRVAGLPLVDKPDASNTASGGATKHVQACGRRRGSCDDHPAVPPGARDGPDSGAQNGDLNFRFGSGTYVQSTTLAGGYTCHSGPAMNGRQLRFTDWTPGSVAWPALSARRSLPQPAGLRASQ